MKATRRKHFKPHEDREIFSREIKSYKEKRKSIGTVTTQEGCLVVGQDEDTVLQKIEFGQYDLMYTNNDRRR
ncbi:MAG: hypothetical protein DMF61_13700 [Blastocatellia bacterium AA13]|nr:MAG: hypothetical protein DMF61_13700 [Blastocatellia bacterium AA13]